MGGFGCAGFAGKRGYGFHNVNLRFSVTKANAKWLAGRSARNMIPGRRVRCPHMRPGEMATGFHHDCFCSGSPNHFHQPHNATMDCVVLVSSLSKHNLLLRLCHAICNKKIENDKLTRLNCHKTSAVAAKAPWPIAGFQIQFQFQSAARFYDRVGRRKTSAACRRTGTSGHGSGSAGFPTCRIADFPIGNAPKYRRPWSILKARGLEMRDPADWKSALPGQGQGALAGNRTAALVRPEIREKSKFVKASAASVPSLCRSGITLPASVG